MIDDSKINALVAEHVFGMSLEPGFWLHPSPLPDWWDEKFDRATDRAEAPDACNSGDVMLCVIEAMRMLGHERFEVITLELMPGETGRRGFAIFYGKAPGESGDADYDGAPRNLPRAVALAALKALGVEVPQ